MLQLTSRGEDMATRVKPTQGDAENVLDCLYRAGNSMSAAEVQDDTNLLDEQLIKAVQRLIDKGYVVET